MNGSVTANSPRTSSQPCALKVTCSEPRRPSGAACIRPARDRRGGDGTRSKGPTVPPWGRRFASARRQRFRVLPTPPRRAGGVNRGDRNQRRSVRQKSRSGWRRVQIAGELANSRADRARRTAGAWIVGPDVSGFGPERSRLSVSSTTPLRSRIFMSTPTAPIGASKEAFVGTPAGAVSPVVRPVRRTAPAVGRHGYDHYSGGAGRGDAMVTVSIHVTVTNASPGTVSVDPRTTAGSRAPRRTRPCRGRGESPAASHQTSRPRTRCALAPAHRALRADLQLVERHRCRTRGDSCARNRCRSRISRVDPPSAPPARKKLTTVSVVRARNASAAGSGGGAPSPSATRARWHERIHPHVRAFDHAHHALRLRATRGRSGRGHSRR